ncbi:MAG: SH3 domain-containing protein, partial [Coxiella burnetii]|nr:SH3 domain-containing protein [Coxiella burnetii]
QKGWIKVGDPRNGEVGWVNRDQYHEALQKYYQPDIQTVFIRAEHNEKGKRTIDVVAYKNGKKLTDKEAQQLYEQIKNQQAKESRYMRHVFWDMDKLMAQQMRAFSRWMDNPWNGNLSDFDPTVVQPLIILSPAHSVSQSAPAISKSKKD